MPPISPSPSPLRALLERLAFAVYDGWVWALKPWFARKLKRRAKHEPLYGEHLPQRFGHYAATRPRPEGFLVWIHAVSLGETRAAAILLPALRQAFASMHLLLTHATATGRTQGHTLLQNGDVQVWQPWDTRTATEAFIQHFKPDVGLLMETELWPNLVRAATRYAVPIVLVNARMSAQTYRKTRRLSLLSRPTLARFSHVLAQTQADAQRLLACGAPRAAVLGNVKFDVTINPAWHEQAQHVLKTWRKTKPVVLFASTREGEEAAFLSALKSLPRPTRQSVQWLIVPRHPQRFEAVAHLITAAGFALSRREDWNDPKHHVDPEQTETETIYLGDSLGEMPLYYALSTVALLGGSFEPMGGQNLIEGLAYGCPFVVGPHTFNFQQATASAINQGLAVRAKDIPHAVSCALAWTTKTSPPQLASLKQAATQWVMRVMSQQGASAKTAQAIQDIVRAQPRKHDGAFIAAEAAH